MLAIQMRSFDDVWFINHLGSCQDWNDYTMELKSEQAMGKAAWSQNAGFGGGLEINCVTGIHFLFPWKCFPLGLTGAQASFNNRF